ncbi:MAG TPA: hypothetical protein VNO43_03210 [Candidatus Eisenbacteria bacterium]|nr:hypothetical protein [Candidatus Eisenbacteria bacterium]
MWSISTLKSATVCVRLDPSLYPSIRFLGNFPEKPMGLTFDEFQLGSRKALGENFRLRDVVAAHDIGIADCHQCGDIYVTKAVGSFPVVSRDAELQIIRQLGVRGPRQIIKSSDLLWTLAAKLASKISIGITDFMPNEFLKTRFDQFHCKIKGQPRDTIGATTRRGNRTTRSED